MPGGVGGVVSRGAPLSRLFERGSYYNVPWSDFDSLQGLLDNFHCSNSVKSGHTPQGVNGTAVILNVFYTHLVLKHSERKSDRAI